MGGAALTPPEVAGGCRGGEATAAGKVVAAGAEGLVTGGEEGFTLNEACGFEPEEKPPELPLFDQAGADARIAASAIAESCLGSKNAPDCQSGSVPQPEHRGTGCQILDRLKDSNTDKEKR